MATNTNQFLVSVADALLIDKDTDQVVVKARTLINSALKQAVQSTPIRGGFGSMKLFTFMNQKELTSSLEDAVFSEAYLALQNNTMIQTVLDNDYILDESVTLVAGSGTLVNAPVGNIYVQKPDKSIVTITPTGSSFSVAGLTTEKVKVTYKYQTTVDKIVIAADKFPKAFKLILKAKLFSLIPPS
jgi:hypothetical protein